MERLNIGIPDMKIANLFEDVNILKQVQNLAEHILEDDHNLIKDQNKKLKELIKTKFTQRIEI